MEEKVIKLAANCFGMPEVEITLASELRKDFNATDVEIADFFLQLEKVFVIPISKDDAKRVKTIADVVTYVEDHAEEIT